MPRPAWAFPALSILFFGLATLLGFGGVFRATLLEFALSGVLLVILFGTVFAAVHHAEVIAHRTGEPYGTLVLTVAVTVIEVALIASIMLGERPNPTLARDTVFAVIMIVCNGLVGVCILAGGLRYHEQDFRITGANAYLSVLIVLATLTLVLPNYVETMPGPIYAGKQLAFVSVVTIALYGVFLYIQTVRHRDYFIVAHNEPHEAADHVPSDRQFLASILLLLVALGGVILLAKKFAVVVDAGTAFVGAPVAVAGVIVALLILLPEGVAAVSAARRDELQKSLNLALGSSLATIGLTVPAVAVVNLFLQQDLVLGLVAKDIVLLTLTILVSLLTFGTGQTNILFGFVHVVIFATFVFLTFVP